MEDLCARLSVVESQLKIHRDLDEAHWVNLDKKLEDSRMKSEQKFDELEDKFESSIEKLEDKIETKFGEFEKKLNILVNKRSSDKGFLSGVMFVLTVAGGAVGAILAYVFR